MGSSAREIKASCLRWLAVRDYSKKELLQKLTVLGHPRDAALGVIDELAENGWQDDSRYAESYARSRILKGYGPARIAYELQQNGVANAGADLNAIVQATVGSWMTLLEQVYRKKFGWDDPTDMNDWAKRSRFLSQRGFTGDMISELLKHLNILRFKQ